MLFKSEVSLNHMYKKNLIRFFFYKSTNPSDFEELSILPQENLVSYVLFSEQDIKIMRVPVSKYTLQSLSYDYGRKQFCFHRMFLQCFRSILCVPRKTWWLSGSGRFF